jgi:hypothetical protein
MPTGNNRGSRNAVTSFGQSQFSVGFPLQFMPHFLVRVFLIARKIFHCYLTYFRLDTEASLPVNGDRHAHRTSFDKDSDVNFITARESISVIDMVEDIVSMSAVYARDRERFPTGMTGTAFGVFVGECSHEQ